MNHYVNGTDYHAGEVTLYDWTSERTVRVLRAGGQWQVVDGRHVETVRYLDRAMERADMRMGPNRRAG
jgi:hypothetical protein